MLSPQVDLHPQSKRCISKWICAQCMHLLSLSCHLHRRVSMSTSTRCQWIIISVCSLLHHKWLCVFVIYWHGISVVYTICRMTVNTMLMLFLRNVTLGHCPALHYLAPSSPRILLPVPQTHGPAHNLQAAMTMYLVFSDLHFWNATVLWLTSQMARHLVLSPPLFSDVIPQFLSPLWWLMHSVHCLSAVVSMWHFCYNKWQDVQLTVVDSADNVGW